jgi:hypothetical protein
MELMVVKKQSPFLVPSGYRFIAQHNTDTANQLTEKVNKTFRTEH